MKRALFVHIPKTAGTSVSRSLDCYKIQLKRRSDDGNTKKCITFKHRIPKDIPEKGRYLVEDAFKFTFVRDPYDRAVSIWGYSTAGKRPFVEFFEEIEEYHNKASDKGRVYSPQWMWFDGMDYDFVGRYESLEADVKKVHELTGIPYVEFPALNGSPRGPIEQYFEDDKAVAVVHRMYKKDFELLGYPM